MIGDDLLREQYPQLALTNDQFQNLVCQRLAAEEMEVLSEKNQDFFPDNNATNKKRSLNHTLQLE